MTHSEETGYQSITWENESLFILDQTHLPEREVNLQLTSTGQVWDAIKKLKVRGAPAIGIAGAYGLYLGIRELDNRNYETFERETERMADYLNSARPTAVNLSWALERLKNTIRAHKERPVEEIKKIVLETVITIHDEDRRLCKAIGENGLEIVPENANILTHCNTGGLATSQYGTAFSVIYHAHINGLLKQAWVDETRPLLQGSRLTAWEMQKAGIPFKLIVDSAAAFVIKAGMADLIITGADRISANGDTANKIGTYNLAVLANYHNIPFYIAAPYSTIDLNLETGDDIIIEERESDEVTSFGVKPTAPDKTETWNPAFDITPASLITGIITEKGIIKPDYKMNLQKMMESRVV
ncbi:MAG: S-methyl-5-thioribose-1-phosphate isomerase [Balneolaceae bacterium]